jgi:hypothetical protein
LPRALHRFAEDSGVIIYASWQPWPLHRDLDSGKTAWSPSVGLTLAQGFEKPPTPNMQFHFKSTLADIGKRPFPTTGDLRFRPCLPPAAGTADFQPLATLIHPDGKPYGHGIAAIKYTAGPFAPARIIYVWMRMWDVTDRTQLLQKTLSLAAAMKASGN